MCIWSNSDWSHTTGAPHIQRQFTDRTKEKRKTVGNFPHTGQAKVKQDAALSLEFTKIDPKWKDLTTDLTVNSGYFYSLSVC